MRSFRQLAAWLAALWLLTSAPALAQLDALEFQAERVPVGTVFHYLKSQRDGSHATRVSVYMASMTRVESLKWDRGGEEATLVMAEMDWSTFSVRHFEAWGLSRGAAAERRATLSVTGDELRMSLMEAPLELHHWPWHSYDFDFTSLNLVLAHRRQPRRPFTFWRTDFVYSDPPVVAEIGELRLELQRREKRGGQRLWRYSLAGPGLEGKSGDWWVDPRTGLTVEYELPVGDEPGYADVRFRLQESSRLTPSQWEEFKRKAVAGS